jgi:uncharacterized protein YndB with AHSA1/START domain
MSKKQITLERTFTAAIEDVWALWTTKEGIESWWGPEGFTVTVRKIDLRPGGELLYAMSATGPDQIASMTRSSRPAASATRTSSASFRASNPTRTACSSS